HQLAILLGPALTAPCEAIVVDGLPVVVLGHDGEVGLHVLLEGRELPLGPTATPAFGLGLANAGASCPHYNTPRKNVVISFPHVPQTWATSATVLSVPNPALMIGFKTDLGKRSSVGFNASVLK